MVKTMGLRLGKVVLLLHRKTGNTTVVSYFYSILFLSLGKQ